MEKKKSPTKKQNFETLLTLPSVKENADLVEFINKEIALLDKKNASKKPTKTQQENEVLTTTIFDYMVEGEKYSISDLIKQIPELDGLPTQRVSPMMRKLMEANLVVRTEIKGKAYFSKA